MIVAIPVHLVAIIVWLGGLFLLTVILGSPIREQAMNATISVWYDALSKFFVWGSLCLLAIVGSCIAIVHLRFGGFSGVPTIHRLNMIAGIPAIGIYAYAQAVPWRACRRAVAGSDWGVAKESISRVHALFVIVLILGLVASIVSGAARVALVQYTEESAIEGQEFTSVHALITPFVWSELSPRDRATAGGISRSRRMGSSVAQSAIRYPLSGPLAATQRTERALRNLVVEHPRVPERGKGGREAALPSIEALRAGDPRVAEQVVLGVSTRGYEISLEQPGAGRA